MKEAGIFIQPQKSSDREVKAQSSTGSNVSVNHNMAMV